MLSLSAIAGCLPVPPAGPATTPPSEPSAGPVELWPGKGPGDLYRPFEVRAFELTQGEGLRGTSWGRYEGPITDAPGLHRFTTRVELHLPGRPPLRSDGEIVVDARGDLVRGFERSDAALLAFERKGDLLVLSAGRQIEELAFPPGTAYMAFAAILHEELMLGLRPVTTAGLAFRLVSLSGSMPTEWSANVAPGPDNAASLTTSLGVTSSGKSIALSTINCAAAWSRSRSRNGDGSSEWNNCESVRTRISITPAGPAPGPPTASIGPDDTPPVIASHLPRRTPRPPGASPRVPVDPAPPPAA